MKKSTIQIFGLANAFSLDDEGWALIPYGESRHSGREARADIAAGNAKKGIKQRPVIQRFDREAAVALVNDFRSTMGSIKRAIVGLPIFKGHPDASSFAHLWPDKTPRGTIADMQVSDEGLRIRPVLTEQGAKDVTGGLKEFSPYWHLKKVGEEAGAIVAAPCRLLSIGLCEKGNIPGLSLVNTDEDELALSNSIMKEHLIKLLAAMGKPLAADADEATITAAVDSAFPTLAAANAAEGQLTNLKTEKSAIETKLAEAESSRTALETEKVALVNSRTTLEGEVTALKRSLAAERKERSMLLANAAVTDGRIPAAERDSTVTALCNASDFDAEVAKLASRAKALPTQSQASKLAEGRGAEGSKGQQIITLVNAFMKENEVDYTTAFTAVQNNPKHAELFKVPAKAK